jgi:sugar phosphate isomerase/epimerase
LGQQQPIQKTKRGTKTMKLGFASAILPDQLFDTVVSFAAEHGYRCVEMMSWPVGKSERRYAGVTHIDVDTLDAAHVEAIKAKLAETGVEISALGYYPNALDPDAEKAQVAINHIKKLITAAPKIGVHTVNTFIGRNQFLSVSENMKRITVSAWRLKTARCFLRRANGRAAKISPSLHASGGRCSPSSPAQTSASTSIRPIL